MGCLHSTAAREYQGHENPVKLASETACKFYLLAPHVSSSLLIDHSFIIRMLVAV